MRAGTAQKNVHYQAVTLHGLFQAGMEAISFHALPDGYFCHHGEIEVDADCVFNIALAQSEY